jgi:hypothetical protein
VETRHSDPCLSQPSNHEPGETRRPEHRSERHAEVNRILNSLASRLDFSRDGLSSPRVPTLGRLGHTRCLVLDRDGPWNKTLIPEVTWPIVVRVPNGCDLGLFISLVLTDSTVQHDDSFFGHLRNWQVSGSNDEQSWEVLRHHANDCSLAERQPRVSAAWHILSSVSPKPYRYFLITQTGPNAGGTHALHCRALELCGTVTLNK